MVWYGMVWYGMVWYGMVWYGMVWYGMVCTTNVHLTIALYDISRARKNVESEELAKKRKRNQGKRKATSDEENLKNFQCKRFKQGLCTLADSCKYSHETLETSKNDEKNQ